MARKSYKPEEIIKLLRLVEIEERCPTFDTILKVVRALGLKLNVEVVLPANSTVQ